VIHVSTLAVEVHKSKPDPVPPTSASAALDADAVAAAARKLAAIQGGTKVTTLGETQALISSSLTAVDLRGLTALDLAFSVLMIAGVTGLVLALGLAERRRSLTILLALGRLGRRVKYARAESHQRVGYSEADRCSHDRAADHNE
jgi:hypothetical protein